jgi:carbon catabolite-derepressing protein kinase
MDLQLYRIDDQNYLVDFRNLGYRAIKPTPASSSSPSLSQSLSVDSMVPNTADEVRLRKPELGQKQSNKRVTGAEVSSPYLFLECAVRLIVELASPAGGETT